MKTLMMLLTFLFAYLRLTAQAEETNINIAEQQLENTTENNEDVETEDDSYLQLLRRLLKTPLDLNAADADDLKELRLLTPLQVQQFILYRTLAGKLINIHELQAVPGWDVPTIHKIRPYLIVGEPAGALPAIMKRFKNGEHSILIRTVRVLEKSKGYLRDSSVAGNLYEGSPQKILFRYRYVYKNLLQYGMLGEKDAGEQFFRGHQKQGFDFYSFHLFMRRAGLVRSLAIGDFTVNLGQGLIQWQSLAFKKSADVINIKREGDILRPYNSPGESLFHRGAGISLINKQWQLTAFASYRKLDANLISDTLQNQNPFVTSFQTSGYHRTKSEAADRGVQRQAAFGGNISYRHKNFYAGVNGIWYRFKLPLMKPADPHNMYALSGKQFGNYSIDFSYSFKNIHFFGEAAFTSSFDNAFASGLIASVSSVADVSVLYRRISKSYQSLYASAFTENTHPTNEKGLYAGVQVRPLSYFSLDAYVDLYQFPWLKYRVNAASNGADYFIQLTYKPNKQAELSSRYRSETKSLNINPGNHTLSPVMKQPVKNWRLQVNYKISSLVTLRNRVEMVWVSGKDEVPEQGFLTFFDLLYRPPLKPLSASIRIQYFESDGYNSRLYTYENDVLYSYSVPVYYDKGIRYYININYEKGKKLALWFRWAQTLYSNKTLVGSGLDEIRGNRRSELKLQALYKF